MSDSAHEDELVDHFVDLLWSTLFLFCLWTGGRLFKLCSFSPIIAEIIVGVIFRTYDLVPNPTFWQMIGQVGITFLIMESGTHLHVERLQHVGRRFIDVAVLGTVFPIVFGIVVYGPMLGFDLYPDATSAGFALAPTSVGIAVALLNEVKKLQTDAGQTIVAAAFIDDVLSLIGLVILLDLASSGVSAQSIILPFVYSFLFVLFGYLVGHVAFPRMLNPLLGTIKEKPKASIQPRDEMHIIILLAMLVGCSVIGHFIGSHLLGAFVTGLCFVKVPRTTLILQSQFKRIVGWLIRIFFGATIAFTVPAELLLDVTAFWQSLVATVIIIIGAKLVSSLHIGVDRWVVGWAMVGRGEFAFLVAEIAQRTPVVDHSGNSNQTEVVYLMSQPVYASVVWALCISMIITPFAFRCVLQRRFKNVVGSGVRKFKISVQGHHHLGAVHEVAAVLHEFGLDISEAQIETDGVVDKEVFTVFIRGNQATDELSAEKIEELRGMVAEAMLGEAEVLVLPCDGDPMHDTEAMCKDAPADESWLDVNIVGDHDDTTLNDVIELLESFDLLVVRADSKEVKTKDIVHLFVKDCAKRTAPLERQEIRNELHQLFKNKGVKGQAMVKVIDGNCAEDLSIPHLPPDYILSQHGPSIFDPAGSNMAELMEVRVRGVYKKGLVQAITNTLKAGHLEIIGAEILRTNHQSSDKQDVLTFYVKDDNVISEGMRLIRSSLVDAEDVVRRARLDHDNRRESLHLVKPPTLLESKTSFRGRSGSMMSTDDAEPRDGLIFHQTSFSVPKRERGDSMVLHSTSSFDVNSFVNLRRKSIMISLQHVCEELGVMASVTVRPISEAFMQQKPDSEERKQVASEIARHGSDVVFRSSDEGSETLPQDKMDGATPPQDKADGKDDTEGCSTATNDCVVEQQDTKQEGSTYYTMGQNEEVEVLEIQRQCSPELQDADSVATETDNEEDETEEGISIRVVENV